MKKDSLSQNFFLQFLYQAVILIIPLIISPYLTRVLREQALGTYTYVNSIAYYFVILSNLGISRHGQRIISKKADDEIELRRTFWSLFFAHIVISVVISCTYLLYVMMLVKENKVIYYIEYLFVLSALFDITWLFYGLENFKSVVLRNTLIKVAELILIVCFVKDESDLVKYALISAGGILAGQIIMLPKAIKMIRPIKFSVGDVRQHLKPLIIFSVSTIAVTLYTVFDKTLLGLMSGEEDVAFYEYANRIITVPKAIISVIGTVMYPRVCKLAARGDNNMQHRFVRFSVMLTALIGMGAIFGLCAISDLFAVVYFGESFAVCGNVMKTLSPLIVIIGLGDILRTQCMLPNGMDKQYVICLIFNAIINLILSVTFIPYLGIYGAVVGTTAAELFGLILQMVWCKQFISGREIIKEIAPFVLFGGIIFIVIKKVEQVVTYDAVGLLIQVAVGGVLYLIFCGILLFVRKKQIVFNG